MPKCRRFMEVMSLVRGSRPLKAKFHVPEDRGRSFTSYPSTRFAGAGIFGWSWSRSFGPAPALVSTLSPTPTPIPTLL